ncbi:MAG: HAD-IIIC family phosphatase [Ignavibacteria bacterium]
MKKNLKKDFSSLPVKKIAILGDTSTQLLVQAIRGFGYEEGINLDIFEAEYDQIDHEVFDADSELYSSNPDFVIIFQAVQKLLNKYNKSSDESKRTFANDTLAHIKDLTGIINSRNKCKIIFFNYAEINDNVFGNFANKLDFSFIYNLRKINLGLMDLSRELKYLYINDINLLQSSYGFERSFDAKLYVTADMVFSLDFIPPVAKSTVDIILSLSGKAKKCLILDLDNTMWGGIIGDDGVENIQIGELGIGKAFTELQLWAKQLKQRGIILAVCSKNDHDVARSAFDNHPDMVLKYEDFAVFQANWDNKAENIKQIQEFLNIGFDSMVFLDDNPFERNLVKSFLPEVTIPDLPEDPAEYLNYLSKLNLFETSSYSEEDSGRSDQYRVEFERSLVKKAFTNEDEYLESLEMVSECKSFDVYSIPRVSQLTQRSNQFNLRTQRYSESDVKNIAESNDYITLSFTLEDKFGHYGLISLVILKKEKESLFIDTWIMSCRVLKRTMENFVLNSIVEAAKSNGFSKLVGEFIPTAKNKMVKDHYKNFGFGESDGKFIMDLDNYTTLKTFIKRKDS